MERSHRPPPLNLTPPGSARNSTRHTRNKSSQSRLSRFAESFQSYNKASPLRSIFEHDADKWSTGAAMTVVRVVGDFAHILASMLLLLIMAFFLNYCDHNPAVATVTTGTGPAALALILLLGLDVLLDFQSIGRYDEKWYGWALVARLLFGVGYMTVFVTYAAMGGAFPSRYTYWGLPQRAASPVAYMFLWILA
jgi:ABC-type multidrug transport system fused ATPase/permease subunit